MRFWKSLGAFFLGVLFQLLWHWDRSLIAWLLLALHFWLRISLWWFVGGLLIWLLPAFLWAAMVGLGRRASANPDRPKENRNPYSHTDVFSHEDGPHTN